MTRVFIGLENINPDNLAAAKKRQNKITEYRKMLLAWKTQGIMTLVGYILGFPADTAESIRRDIEIIKKELPLDILEFFCLTPLPGSEDHRSLWRSGVSMDTDLNNYDVEHVCTAHPNMSKTEWGAIYREAWALYYTPEHMEVLLRRVAATGLSMASLLKVLVTFATAVSVENVHPLQGGLLRLKHPSERRPCLPRERQWIFWTRFVLETLVKQASLASMIARLVAMKIRIDSGSTSLTYTDQALSPAVDEDEENLALFTHTESARAAVVHAKKVARLTNATRAPLAPL